MNMPCSNVSDCFPCFVLPTANATSEMPDVITSFSINYGSASGNTPPLGYLFASIGCVSVCESTVSQLDADLCAARQQAACATPPCNNPSCSPEPPPCLSPPCDAPPTHPPVDPPRLYGNTISSCISICPDELPFTFTVPAGTFVASSQILANRMALSYACREALIHKVCLSLTNSMICAGSTQSLTFIATGGSLSPSSNYWELRSGSLPAGMSFTPGLHGQVLTISGTPTTGGNSTFTLRVTAPNGDFMEKQFTVCTVDVLPASGTLPNAAPSTAYSQFVSASACAGSNIIWAITDGALPLGLSLNAITGEISGSPDPSTVNQGFIFTIAAQIEA